MNSTLFLLMTIAIFCRPQTANYESQTGNPAVAKIVFMQDISGVSSDDLASALEQLRDRTQQLDNELNQKTKSMQGSTAKSADVNDVHVDGPAVTPADSKKLAEIRQNIELLKKIFKEKMRRKMEAEKQLKATTAHQENGSMAKSVSSGQVLSHFAERSVESDDKDNSDDPQVMESALPPLKVPKQVVSYIVDAFELGNSLFLAGNLDDAIKYYELVPANQLSAFDRNWLELMIACCHRGQGDYEAAELSYRAVASDANGLHASESAKAWLKYVTIRKRLTGQVEEYGSKADTAMQNAESLLEKLGNGKSN